MLHPPLHDPGKPDMDIVAHREGLPDNRNYLLQDSRLDVFLLIEGFREFQQCLHGAFLLLVGKGEAEQIIEYIHEDQNRSFVVRLR